MRTPHQSHNSLLDENSLPGPNTTTKQQALLDRDPRFQQMLRESASLGWPAAFGNDLYLHDRQILAAHPDASMVWVLRSHGTHLFPAVCETRGEAAYARNVMHYWSGEHTLNFSDDPAEAARYYRVTNASLTPLTWQQACAAVLTGQPQA